MIVVHHLIIGRSIFTVWLLEELGLEYELVTYERNPETMRAPASLKNAHPLGKSPVIEDDGMTIAESGAIASYLLERYDPDNKLAPPPSDIQRWTTFTQWLHYAEGSVFAPLLITMLLQRAQQPPGLLDAFAAGEVQLQLDYIADQLGDNDYILEDGFSAADIGIGYMVSMAQRLELLGNYPSLDAYAKRVQSRPAFLRAFDRTGG